MLKFLIDENLPYNFSLWKGEAFIHVADLSLGLKDIEIWEYAKQYSLTIVTKDADFSNKVILNTPPPKVIHIRVGNMKIKDFFVFLNSNWEAVSKVSESYKLVNLFKDRIEGID